MRPGNCWLRRFGYTEHGNSRAKPIRPPKGWPDGRSCSNMPLENLCLSDRVGGPVDVVRPAQVAVGAAVVPQGFKASKTR